MNHTVRAQVTIEAPRALVWEVLVDFDRYSKWNPFTPHVVLPSRRLGETVELHVRMSARHRRVMLEQLRVFDPPDRLAWGVSIAGGRLVQATRHQVLVALGEERTSYESYETFRGLLAPVVLRLFGKDVERGFEASAMGLKERAEALHRGEPRD